MSAVWMRVRADVAARKRGIVALGLMIGVFGTASVATAAGARRTSSSVRRFLAETRAGDVEVGNNLDAKTRAAVVRLPQVKTAAPYTFFIMAPEAVVRRGDSTSHELLGASIAGLSFGTPTDEIWLRTVDRPRVVRGRMPGLASADEIVVNESLARKYQVGVGDRFTFHAYSIEQLLPVVFGGENQPPNGPRLTGRIVGVVRLPIDLATAVGGGYEAAFGGPAFYRENVDSAASFGINLIVRLRRGAEDLPAFTATIEQMAAAGVSDELFAQSRSVSYSPAEDAARVQAIALALFSGLMALATVLVLGQSLSRGIHAAARDHPALRALGMSRRDLVVAGIVPATISVLVGAALAVAGAVAASQLFPVGFARRAEPHPGVAIDATALLLGATVLALLLIARSAVAAWRSASARDDDLEARPSALGEAVSKTRLPTSVAIGTRMALAPAGGRAAASVRAATIGAVVALAAMGAGLGIASSIHHLVRTPRLYGTNWDVGFSGGDSPESVAPFEARISKESVIGDFSTALLADVFVGGKRTQSFGIDPVRGNVYLSLIEGRQPRGTAEVALGTETLRRMKLRLGDTVTVKSETSASMKIVGRAVFPGIDDDTLGDGVAMDMPAFRALKLDQNIDFTVFIARYRAGVDAKTAFAGLVARYGQTNVAEATLPPAVANLQRVQDMPPQLADLLLLLAVATIAHTVVTTVRERRRDIAILKTLGFVRRQAVGVVASQATTFMIVALLLGLPLGYAGAKWTWTTLANRIGFAPAPVIEAAALVIYGVGVLVAANVIAAWPGRIAARSKPSIVLRTE